MPLTEASLSVWLFAFARLAGWAVVDPWGGRLPLWLRLFLAAVLAAVLAPGLMPGAATPFLAASGHLLVVHTLRDSFVAMPVAAMPAATDVRQLAEAGSWLFATGVQLALPLLALALLIQLAFSIVARTTPGLDMFSVGLGLAALGLVAAWIAAVPLLSRGVGLGVEQLAVWLGRLG